MHRVCFCAIGEELLAWRPTREIRASIEVGRAGGSGGPGGDADGAAALDAGALRGLSMLLHYAIRAFRAADGDHTPPRVIDIFRLLDRDNSGSVSFDELQIALRRSNVRS